jgi:glutathione synthase/RimK-type ligase-like ATP-grasp enzyme
MNGILIFNNQTANQQTSIQIQNLIEAFKKWQLKVIPVSTAQIQWVLETSTKGFFKFAFLFDEDTQIAKFLEQEHQLKVFNDETTINISRDRALLGITLRNAGIPNLTTIALPYTVNQNIMTAYPEVKAMVQDMPYPFLIKNRVPEPAEKFYLIRHEADLKQVLTTIGMQPLIAQTFIPQETCQHFKVLVVGKTAVVATEVTRQQLQEHIQVKPVSSEVKRLAILTAKTIGAHHVWVSVFVINHQQHVVFSVKTNPNFIELQALTGFKIYQEIAKHLYQQVKKLI